MSPTTPEPEAKACPRCAELTEDIRTVGTVFKTLEGLLSRGAFEASRKLVRETLANMDLMQ